jgi:hypothetical protein
MSNTISKMLTDNPAADEDTFQIESRFEDIISMMQTISSQLGQSKMERLH